MSFSAENKSIIQENRVLISGLVAQINGQKIG